MMHRVEEIEFDRNDDVLEKGVNYLYVGLFLCMLMLVIFIRPDMFSNVRWSNNLDLSGDGSFTIADAMQWAIWIFSMPGDIIIQALMSSKHLTHFLDLSSKSYGGPGSVIMSLGFWWLMGGKKLVRAWIIILLISLYHHIPSLPLPRA